MSAIEFSMNLPYTCLATKLRMGKRQSETEMADILKEIIHLKNNSQFRTRQEVVEQLKRSRQKLELLKQKVKVQKQQQDDIYNVCRKRVHLDKDVIQKKKQITKQQMVEEFNKEVLQFFACRNKIKQARVIQKSLQDNYYLQLYVDLYDKAYKVSSAIYKNDLRPLKDWCYEHSHFLAKMKSSLQFKLISCLFVNILNNKGGVKAIEFLRKQIATLTLSDHDKQQLDKLMFKVLLAQNQSEYFYYSDSEKQREYRKIVNEPTIIKSPDSKRQKKKKVGVEVVRKSESNSSSSSVEEALFANQQQMGQIFRAFSSIFGVNQSNANNENLNNGGSMDPENHLSSEPRKSDLKAEEKQEEIMEQIYEDQFDSISDQQQKGIDLPPNGQYQMKQINSLKQSKKETKKEGQSYMQGESKSKKIMKEIKRKHKLDKNNLRAYLNQANTEFMAAFSKIYRISFNSTFDKTLAVGISVMKTSNCSQRGHQLGSERGYCPVCTSQIQRICKNIPGTLKNESSLICRINGSLMNEVNYPIALPNGQIYSIKGLQQTQKNGKYFCWADQKWFRKQTCKKVFLS